MNPDLTVQHGVLLMVALFSRVQSEEVPSLRLLVLLPVLHLTDRQFSQSELSFNTVNQ